VSPYKSVLSISASGCIGGDSGTEQEEQRSPVYDMYLLLGQRNLQIHVSKRACLARIRKDNLFLDSVALADKGRTRRMGA
jgi:hypothetical protein